MKNINLVGLLLLGVLTGCGQDGDPIATVENKTNETVEAVVANTAPSISSLSLGKSKFGLGDQGGEVKVDFSFVFSDPEKNVAKIIIYDRNARRKTAFDLEAALVKDQATNTVFFSYALDSTQERGETLLDFWVQDVKGVDSNVISFPVEISAKYGHAPELSFYMSDIKLDALDGKPVDLVCLDEARNEVNCRASTVAYFNLELSGSVLDLDEDVPVYYYVYDNKALQGDYLVVGSVAEKGSYAFDITRKISTSGWTQPIEVLKGSSEVTFGFAVVVDKAGNRSNIVELKSKIVM